MTMLSSLSGEIVNANTTAPRCPKYTPDLRALRAITKPRFRIEFRTRYFGHPPIDWGNITAVVTPINFAALHFMKARTGGNLIALINRGVEIDQPI